jgi:uncharacterized protein YeaO (DUF488 family)
MAKGLRLRIKRAYEPPAPDDGIRILVDRLWPRGIKKENARIDEWVKVIAPSDELRKWFGHDPEKWTEFKRRYAKELSRPEAKAGIESIRGLAKGKAVTLVYSASDEAHNNAVALSEFLDKPKRTAAKRRGMPARTTNPGPSSPSRKTGPQG